MMRLCLLIAFLLTTSLRAAAQDLPTTGTLTSRFGFVDVELVLAESQAIRLIVSEIDTELGRRDGEIRDKQRELQKLRLSLETQGSVLSQVEREKRQQQAVTLLSEVDEMEYRFDREVKRKQATVIEPLLEQVVRIVGEVGRRDGYDLIVRGETVLWGAKSVDLTPVIVRELDLQVDRLREAVQRPAVDSTTESPKATPSVVPLLP
jgi:outer membrane protein